MTNVKKVRIYACPFGYPSPTCGHVIVDQCVAQSFYNQRKIELNSIGQFWTRLKRSELKNLVASHRVKPLKDAQKAKALLIEARDRMIKYNVLDGESPSFQMIEKAISFL